MPGIAPPRPAPPGASPPPPPATPGVHASTSLLWTLAGELSLLFHSSTLGDKTFFLHLLGPSLPPVKQEVQASARFPRPSGPGSRHLAAFGLGERAPRRRPGPPVSAPGSGGAAPAAPRQARGGQVQVAAQEGGGGGAARPRPHLLSPARCAECWDRSIGVVCLCKHRQPREPDALCVFNFALPIAACPRLRRGWRPCLSAFALHSQAPGFLDTVGRGAPLRFLHPRVTDVRAAFLTHLICNAFGSGRSLPYSPGTGKTWLPGNGHSLISQAPEESKILLPPGLGQWRRPGALCLQAQGSARLSPLRRLPRVLLTWVPAPAPSQRTLASPHLPASLVSQSTGLIQNLLPNPLAFKNLFHHRKNGISAFHAPMGLGWGCRSPHWG